MAFEIADEENKATNIRVIGIGGGGGNAVNSMVENKDFTDVQFIAANTDIQALRRSKAEVKIQIGEKATGGRGAGAKPDIGKKAAEESKDAIKEKLQDTQMLFITAGMGGGTGTGAAPVVADIARQEMGILTIGVVTKPFKFEGNVRARQAEEGISELAKHVDSLIIIPNEKLNEVGVEKITLLNAFKIADDVLRQAVQSVSDLITKDGLINLDFADVTSVMKDAGRAHMGIGIASGKGRAETAAKKAITSPLLETSVDNAKGVIVCISASPDVTMDEVNNAMTIINQAASPDANIIFGLYLDERKEDEISFTVIATGFGGRGVSVAGANDEIKPISESLFEDISTGEEDNFETKQSEDNFDVLDIFGSKK